MTPAQLQAKLTVAGYTAYPRDGRPGATVVEHDELVLELDGGGVYDVMLVGKTSPAVRGAEATELHFPPREVVEAAVDAGSQSTDPTANVAAALSAARDMLAALR